MGSYYFVGQSSGNGGATFASPTFTGVSTFPAGTAAAPSISLVAANTGVYQSATNTVDITTNGVLAATFNASQNFVPVAQVLGIAGTAALPTYSTRAANNGVYSPAASQVGVTTNGTLAALWDSSQNYTPTAQVLGVAGAVGTPTFSLGAANTGIYQSATHTVDVSTNGIKAATFDASQNTTLFGTTVTIPAAANLVYSGASRVRVSSDNWLFERFDGANNQTLSAANINANYDGGTNGGLLLGGTSVYGIKIGYSATNKVYRVMDQSNGQTGYILQPQYVLAKTGNYNIAASDSGTCFTNTGAGGAINLNLPTPAMGLRYKVMVTATATVNIITPSGVIQIGSSVSGASKTAAAGTTGSCVDLICTDGTNWVAGSYTLTWTLT